MEGPGLDTLKTERHARLEKREKEKRDQSFWIGIGCNPAIWLADFSTINNITGFIHIWRLRVLVALEALDNITVYLLEYINTVHAIKS